jgi:hypothetical protein
MTEIEEKIISFRKLLTEDEKVFLDKNGFLILKDIPNYLSEKGIDLNIIAAKLDELVSVEKEKTRVDGKV